MFRNKKKTTKYLIDTIRSQGHNADRAFTELYFLHDLHAVAIRAGHKVRSPFDEDDLTSVENDALLELKGKIVDGSYQEQGKLEGYFYKICLWRWQKVYRTTKRGIEIVDQELDAAQPAGEFYDEYILREDLEMALALLDLVGEKCKKLLKLFALGVPEPNLVEILGFKDVQSFRSRRATCRRRYQSLLEKAKKTRP